MPPARQNDESDLSRIAQVIRRRLWVVAICVVAATAAAALLTLRAEERYESTSGLLLRGGSDPQRTADTNLQLLSLPAVAAVAGELAPEIGAEEFEASVGAEQQGESDIIKISANASSPELAAEIANVYAEAFIQFRNEDEGDLAGGKAVLVERAQPEPTPVSPQKAKNIGFGILIGLVLGLGLALLLEQMDRRVKRQDDLPDVTGLPLLTTIPKRKAFERMNIGDGSLSPAEAEIFLMLRANLRYFNVRKDIRSVLVTSAQPGEGKTLVSMGLALGAAMSGERAILIEADMRDPSLASDLGAPGGGGLSWLLSDPNADLARAITPIAARSIAKIAGDAKFDLLPAGQIPPNPTELIESQRMRDLLTQVESEYDFVVVDTPPILLVADAIPLVPSVSGVVAVSGLGVSTHALAHELAEQLDRMEAPTLGLIANYASDTGRSLDGYGYGRPPEQLMKPS